MAAPKTNSAVDFQLSLHSETVQATNPDAPLAINSSATISSVMQLLKAEKSGAALICEGESLVGIFTERDALKLMVSGADLQKPIREFMSRHPVTVGPATTVAEAIKRMSGGGYRHLPIVDGTGKALGMVGVSGIVRYLVDHFPQTIYNLPHKAQSPNSHREGA